MIDRLIEASVKGRVLVIAITAMLAGAGLWAVFNTPVDAIPDLSDVQVIVFTEFTGQAPQVVEDQVTYPLTSALLAVPHARNVRGFSFFGISMVYVIFEDGTDLYWARARVLEYLSTLGSRLPGGVTPTLGPDATGVGWAFMYALTSDRHDLSQLRSLQDWTLRFELMSVPGVSEVASAGGFVKQYQVEVDPERLRAYGVGLPQVIAAIKKSNNDVGGRLLEMGETEFMVRGRGYLRSIDDLADAPVGVDKKTHTPVLLRQLGRVHLGPEIRRGVIEWNGQGEAVAGIVVVRSGENTLEVIDRVKQRLAELKKSLPEGVEIHTAYDRTRLIREAIDTLRGKLLEEMFVVALVIMFFLLHVRSSLVALITLPLGILASFLIMRLMGLSANIMSLGGIAIAIGVMVDASVVMVENLHKHLEKPAGRPHQEIVITAAKEVGPALFFSLLIITISFLPVFTLQQQEGRMFTPLAYTKTFAMAASALLAVTIIPVLMFYFVRGRMRSEESHPVSRWLRGGYLPLIHHVLNHPKWTLLAVVALTALTILPAGRLGSEFMPTLNEGDLLYMPTTPPGISITKAKELLQQTDKVIAAHPLVSTVLGKVGRAETATDPAPLSMIETTIILKPKDQWPAGTTIEDIIAELDATVRFPGLTNSWTMPIKTRLDMLATGIKTPVGIKLMGEDLATLAALGERVEALLRGDPDVRSVYAERSVGGNYIDIDIDRVTAARFGLTVGDVQTVIQSAIGGMNVTSTVEGRERYPVNVRFPRELRDSLDRLRRVPVMTAMQHTVPLGELAKIHIVKGPPMIKSENARPSSWVFVDLKTSDVGGFVRRAKQLVQDDLKLPDGYSLIWSGQYEYMERAQKRLRLVVPLTLAIIFILLYLHFRNLAESMIVMGTLPFALVGGVWLMFLSGYNLSVAAGVGFIALAGLAAETGVVMLVYLDQAYGEWKAQDRLHTLDDLRDVVIAGAVERLRPKIMTVATTILGLLPIMFGTTTGTRVMKRIAAPMVGGLLSSVVLTLVIVPVVYFLWRKHTASPALIDTTPERLDS